MKKKKTTNRGFHFPYHSKFWLRIKLTKNLFFLKCAYLPISRSFKYFRFVKKYHPTNELHAIITGNGIQNTTLTNQKYDESYEIKSSVPKSVYTIYPTVRGGNSRHSKSKEWRASPRLHVILVTSIWYLEVKSSVQGYTFGVSTISKYSRLPNIRPVPRKSIQVGISWKTNKRTGHNKS